MRRRWFGATGRRVPQIALEDELDLDEALVLDSLDLERIREAFERGRPVVVRADSQDDVLEALRRAEVSCVVVSDPKLTELDLVALTYD
ncbi:MAG TPA: hypothetical protein VFM13_09100 [Gaiellaceae bacterium]|nr:hypothetical protein [Gaiellaceae bacterium]